MVSPGDSRPRATRPSATAPPNAFDMLTTRMWSKARIALPVRRSPTPARCSAIERPRWTTATTPGGPLGIATSARSARPSDSSADLLETAIGPRAGAAPAKHSSAISAEIKAIPSSPQRRVTAACRRTCCRGMPEPEPAVRTTSGTPVPAPRKSISLISPLQLATSPGSPSPQGSQFSTVHTR
jgi:hypothetical protein